MDLAVFVGVAALAFIHPELLRYSMFHGTGVLAPHSVVGDPTILGSAFAVFSKFGVVVDSTLRIIVLDPADMTEVPDVHVESLEGDASGDDTVELVGFDLGVKEAVAEGGGVEHFGLAAGDGALALHRSEVAPDRGGEQIASELITGDAFEDLRSLCFGGSLGVLLPDELVFSPSRYEHCVLAMDSTDDYAHLAGSRSTASRADGDLNIATQSRQTIQHLGFADTAKVTA